MFLLSIFQLLDFTLKWNNSIIKFLIHYLILIYLKFLIEVMDHFRMKKQEKKSARMEKGEWPGKFDSWRLFTFVREKAIQLK